MPPDEAKPRRSAPRRALERVGHVLDARLLVWLLLVAAATGIALVPSYRVDLEGHRLSLEAVPAARWLRGLHATATTLLVAGASAHLLARIGRRAERPSDGTPPARLPAPTVWGVRTGGLALAAVGLAAVSGALLAHTDHAQDLRSWLGASPDAVWPAIVHVAYASILAAGVVFLHVARHGWRRLVGTRWHAVVGVAVALALLVPFPGSMPSESGWSSATWVAVPPVPALWSWTMALGGVVAAAARRLVRSHGAH